MGETGYYEAIVESRIPTHYYESKDGQFRYFSAMALNGTGWSCDKSGWPTDRFRELTPAEVAAIRAGWGKEAGPTTDIVSEKAAAWDRVCTAYFEAGQPGLTGSSSTMDRLLNFIRTARPPEPVEDRTPIRVVPPCPELPPGWEWTGEYKVPENKDHFYWPEMPDVPQVCCGSYFHKAHILRRKPEGVKPAPSTDRLFTLYAAFMANGRAQDRALYGARAALAYFDQEASK